MINILQLFSVFYNLHITSTIIQRREYRITVHVGGSVAEWLACWTQAQKARVQIAVAMLSGNSLKQTAHTHYASVHQAAKLVAALFRVAGITAGLAKSDGSLPPGLSLTSPAGWLPRSGISSRILRSVIEYGLPLTVFYCTCAFTNSQTWLNIRSMRDTHSFNGPFSRTTQVGRYQKG